jgi:ABC-2 type transport system permease protein
MIWLLYDLVVPLAYLLIFGVGLTRMTQGQILWGQARLSYGAFFLGGVLAMSSFGSAAATAWGFFTDRDNGIFYEFLTYPMSRGQLLLGKILFNMVVAVVRAAICIAAAALALDVPVRWDLLPWLVAALVVGTAGWFFFLSNLALRIRRNDTFNTVMDFLYFVLLFTSSMFYPLDSLPAGLRSVAYANPLTWHADFFRYASLGIGGGGRLALEAALFCLFTLLAFWAATLALTQRD